MRFARFDSPQGSSSTGWSGAKLPQPIAKLRVSVDCTKMKTLTVPRPQKTKGRFAQVRRLFKDRLEHRLKVAGRCIDDLQDLGGRGLLLQCLARLGQQPRVFHCDDRLCREILQERDLLVGEWPDLL